MQAARRAMPTLAMPSLVPLFVALAACSTARSASIIQPNLFGPFGNNAHRNELQPRGHGPQSVPYYAPTLPDASYQTAPLTGTITPNYGPHNQHHHSYALPYGSQPTSYNQPVMQGNYPHPQNYQQNPYNSNSLQSPANSYQGSISYGGYPGSQPSPTYQYNQPSTGGPSLLGSNNVPLGSTGSYQSPLSSGYSPNFQSLNTPTQPHYQNIGSPPGYPASNPSDYYRSGSSNYQPTYQLQ